MKPIAWLASMLRTRNGGGIIALDVSIMGEGLRFSSILEILDRIPSPLSQVGWVSMDDLNRVLDS